MSLYGLKVFFNNQAHYSENTQEDLRQGVQGCSDGQLQELQAGLSEFAELIKNELSLRNGEEKIAALKATMTTGEIVVVEATAMGSRLSYPLGYFLEEAEAKSFIDNAKQTVYRIIDDFKQKRQSYRQRQQAWRTAHPFPAKPNVADGFVENWNTWLRRQEAALGLDPMVTLPFLEGTPLHELNIHTAEDDLEISFSYYKVLPSNHRISEANRAGVH